MTVEKMIKYREIWMGIAMLWIILYHSGIELPNVIMKMVKDVGYGGVDIFLFASGIGNYYSYTKDERALAFLERRIMRLAPVYIPFITIWNILNMILGRLNPKFFIGNLFGVQVFSNAGISFNWYLAVLIVCYVLTPFFASFIKEHNVKKCFMFIAFLLLISTAFWTDNKFVISATRLPIYAIGMICAKYASWKIKKAHVVVGILLFAIGVISLGFCYKFYAQYLWPYGLYWYPFIVITPFLCFLVSYVVVLTEHIHLIALFWEKCIKPFGRYSFEFYLVHIFIFENIQPIWEKFKIEFPLNNWIWILAFILAILGVWILHAVSKLVNNILIGMRKEY